MKHRNNWVTREYPHKHELQAPHPFINEWQPCRVTNHLLGGFNNTSVIGIVVRFDDGEWQEITSDFLKEDGTGV